MDDVRNVRWMGSEDEKRLGDMSADELLKVVVYLLGRVEAEREITTKLFAMRDARLAVR